MKDSCDYKPSTTMSVATCNCAFKSILTLKTLDRSFIVALFLNTKIGLQHHSGYDISAPHGVQRASDIMQ